MKIIYFIFALFTCLFTYASNDKNFAKAPEIPTYHVSSAYNLCMHEYTRSHDSCPQKRNDGESPEKDEKKGMSFEVWAGILLAAAALLITILGVFIAILSIYGYKKIMTSAQEAAASKSKEAAEHIMKTMIEKATTDALIDIIENGKLNSVINESVEKVVYRGIKIDNIEEEIEQ